jgi:AraC-like DNA-binding protein
VWGRSARELVARVEGAAIEAQLAAFEHALVARLANRRHDDALAAAAVAWIARHPEAHVAQLARELGISARQLQRRVLAATGYAPKLLHRVLRFQRALVALGDPSTTLAGVAADAGYLDQAHLTREVRALAGATPKELAARSLDTASMSDFFKTLDRGTAMVAA